MQVMFVQEGMNWDLPPLPLSENLDETTRKQLELAKSPMCGVIVLNVVMARNLRSADLITKSSDPYVLVQFPDNKEAKS